MEPSRANWLPAFLKDAASWAVFLWGIAIGVLVTTLFAGLSVRPSYSADWYEVLGFGLLGITSLLAPILALRNRRHAATILLTAAPLVAVCFVFWQRSFEQPGAVSFLQELSLAVAWTAGLLVVPGLFWVITSRRGWRPLNQKILVGNRLRQPIILNSFLLLVLMSVSAFMSLYLPLYGTDCYKGLPPVFAQTSPRHTVFTGRVLSVGRPVNAWSSPWALVQVEHVYWGLPHWMRWIVFVRGYFKDTDKGQEYLVDAHRSEGALTRFLPVVEFYPCCHTVPLSYAQVDLRVLHDGPPKSGVRIIGRVYRVLGGKPGWMFIQGVPVTVTGPVGSVFSGYRRERHLRPERSAPRVLFSSLGVG